MLEKMRAFGKKTHHLWSASFNLMQALNVYKIGDGVAALQG